MIIIVSPPLGTFEVLQILDTSVLYMQTLLIQYQYSILPSPFALSLCIVYLTCSRQCRDSDGCHISRSSSSVGSHREDELSSLLQIILCCETSLLTSGVHSGFRVRRGNWSIPNLICNDDSIRHQWCSPNDVYINLRWRCING